jgi:hypothetical protein
VGRPVEFIDQRTSELMAWLAGVVPAVPVTVLASGSAAPKSGIAVRLTRVSPIGRPRNAGTALELLLRYQVEVRLPDALEEQRALGEIAFAALAGSDYQVDADETDGPVVALIAKLSRVRELKRAPLVRKLRAEVRPGRALGGVVIGPGARPVANALVTIPGTDQRIYTDRTGRFRFEAVPTGEPGIKLMVWARGTQVAVDAAADMASTTIELPMEI